MRQHNHTPNVLFECAHIVNNSVGVVCDMTTHPRNAYNMVGVCGELQRAEAIVGVCVDFIFQRK